jgi:hypothetical protein
MDITIARNDVNDEGLNEEVRAAFGNLTSGISTGPYGVIVHLDDRVTPAQIAQAKAIVENHDPAVLSPRQQAEAQRQQRLASLRTGRGAELDPATYSGEAAPIQTLADKIAWLEQEVLDLRGGSDEL